MNHMKKEVILAIFLGLVVGLVITIGMFRARQAVEETFPTASILPTGSTKAQPLASSSPEATDLQVTSPSNESVTTEENIQVSGRTIPSSSLVVLQDGQEAVGIADEQGNFSIPIVLTAGGNILTIRAHKPDGTTSQVRRSVILSTADLTQAATAATPVATQSTSTKKSASPKPSAKP